MKLALRNVMRNKRRSTLSLLIILSGVAILYLVNGYKSYVYSGMELQAISEYGHFQIATQEFWDQKNDYLLTDEEIKIISNTLNNDENIIEFTQEISFSGVLGTEKGSTIVSGTGVNPGSTRCQNLIINEGTNLFETDTEQVLIGKGIMKKLNLKIGEWVTLMATTVDGAYNAGSLQVAGSFSTGNTDADNYYIILPLSFAQDILYTTGADKVITYLNENEPDTTMQKIKQLEKEFERKNALIQIKSWENLATLYMEVKGMFDLIFFFLSIVIFILVFLSIFEIMSMSFFERMKEIGTIRSIGTKRNQVFWLLIKEALVLGIFGGFLGVIAGWGIGNFINRLGITYYPPTITQPIPLGIGLLYSNCYWPLCIVVFASIISALSPAIKASRINIVEMFRHN